MLCFFAAKGGVGCSVSAAAAALISAAAQPTLLVDLSGDHAELLGVSSLRREGIGDWFQAEGAPPDALHRMEVTVNDGLDLLPLGTIRSIARPERYRTLAALLASDTRSVVVDVGTRAIPAVAVVSQARRSVLVTRSCYLGLRAALAGPRPDDILLIKEPGRSISPLDIAASLEAPVTVSVPWHRDVTRRVDAGLFHRGVPKQLAPIGALL